MTINNSYYRLLIDKECYEEDCPIFIEIYRCEILFCSKKYEKQDNESIVFLAKRKLLSMSLNIDDSINIINLDDGENILVLIPFQ